jgi:dynein intermediate chain
MESTMQQRRDEILAKKAKLAELKRQREIRKADTANRQAHRERYEDRLRLSNRC